MRQLPVMDLDDCRFRQDRFCQARSQWRQPRGSTTILACRASLLDRRRRFWRIQCQRRRRRGRRRVLITTRLTSHVSYRLNPTARRLDPKQPLATLRLELLHAMREAISGNQWQSVAVSGGQRKSVPGSGRQRQSVAIIGFGAPPRAPFCNEGGNQWQSVAIIGFGAPPRAPF